MWGLLEMKRYIPNILSIIRILLCPALLLITENNLMLITLIIGIGLTDILDGYFARKFNCQSQFGSQLDSLGDMLFFIMLLAYVIVYKRYVLIENKKLLMCVVVVKCIPLIIGMIKYKKLVFIHTILNKLSGIMVVIGVITIITFEIHIIMIYVLFFILLAGIEEILIEILVKNPDENRKSVFDLSSKKR